MCSPQLILGAQVAGGAYQTVGAYYAAQGQKSALGAEASIADTNARLAELTAQSALLQGQREEQKVRMNTAQVKSSQRAALAANGVDLGSDSAVNVLSSTDVLGDIDANTVAANAARNAWGYRAQATNYVNEGLIKRSTAKAISPFSSGLTTLLNNATSIATTRYLLGKSTSTDADSASYVMGLGRVK